MRARILLSAAAGAALIGFGALTGSVIGGAFAQAPTQSNGAQAIPVYQAPQVQAQATVTPAPGITPGNNGKGRGNGNTSHPGGPRGRGGFGFGGPGFGGPGPIGVLSFAFAATADQANREIARASSVISETKSDMAYANGKMDTTNVQKWVGDADSLIRDANASVTAARYSQAAGYARAAASLAQLAEQQMGQTLGFNTLPSAGGRPQRPNRGNQNPNGNQTPATRTVTQAQASRVLAGAYNIVVSQGALIKSGNAQASSYLTDAQNAYKTAYNSYQAGKYNDAVSQARLAEQLAGVASTINRAANDATTGTDQPVTVPAPNF